MIWISLPHLSLFLGVSSRRHIFIASFSCVCCKTDSRHPIIIQIQSRKSRWWLLQNRPFQFPAPISSFPKLRIGLGTLLAGHSPYAGRGKHGQSLPCPASLSVPSPPSSGSAWREVSPLLFTQPVPECGNYIWVTRQKHSRPCQFIKWLRCLDYHINLSNTGAGLHTGMAARLMSARWFSRKNATTDVLWQCDTNGLSTHRQDIPNSIYQTTRYTFVFHICQQTSS